MNAQPPVKVQVTHRFDASPERVFDAFLDPEKAGQFLFATATGKVIRCEIDSRVGGSFVIVDRRPEGDAAHYGTYLKIDRPRWLVFKFSVASGDTGAAKVDFDSDLVTIEIVPLKSGCEVTLTHEMKAEFAEHKRRAEEGWTGILEGLAAVLGKAA